MLRLNRLAFVVIVIAAAPALNALAWAQAAKPPTIDGTWKGEVIADMGQMQIAVTLTTTAGVVSGEIANPHGTFKITGGKLVNGVWVLPFVSQDGAKGEMKGKLSGDAFAGDWDFHPMAVGTFALKREK
jgi:hypothetical protein